MSIWFFVSFQDGFVLVGSVTGQRYWSTILPTDVQTVTAATWTPDDKHVYLGNYRVDNYTTMRLIGGRF